MIVLQAYYDPPGSMGYASSMLMHNIDLVVVDTDGYLWWASIRSSHSFVFSFLILESSAWKYINSVEQEWVLTLERIHFSFHSSLCVLEHITSFLYCSDLRGALLSSPDLFSGNLGSEIISVRRLEWVTHLILRNRSTFLMQVNRCIYPLIRRVGELRKTGFSGMSFFCKRRT